MGQFFKFYPNSTQRNIKSLIILSIQVMEMLACNCKRMCVAGTSACVDVGLKRTDACSLGDCENRAINDDEDIDDLKQDIAVNE